jgi:uncharacterized protein YjaZ
MRVVKADETAELGDLVRGYLAEARVLLPALGAVTVHVEVDPASRLLIPEHGVGGVTASADRIVVAVDPTADVDRGVLLRRLRGAVFHECFHIVHLFVPSRLRDRTPTALETAVYEGAATVFERDRAGSEPPWGLVYSEATMLDWAAEVAALPPAYDEQRWKYWDTERKQSWIVYRVGTFLVDRALARHPELAIEDLAARSANEILSLAELP